MDNLQIENKIRKRGDIVTACMFMIFLITISIISVMVSPVFAEELKSVKTLEDIIVIDIEHLNLIHVIEGITIALAIPFIYLQMQKINKRKILGKIWKSKREELNNISKNSMNNVDNVLKNISFELGKLENQVAEVYPIVDYLKYTNTISYLNELIDGTNEKIIVSDWLKCELDKLILANKFPFYGMTTRT